MLKEAQRLLAKGGKIIILTPTGRGSISTLLKHYFLPGNLSIFIWFYATRNRARAWANNKYLKQYSNENKWSYKSKIVMNGLAQIEIIKK